MQDDLEKQAKNLAEIEREHALRAHDRNKEMSTDLRKAATDSANIAIRAMILVNGGAVVALLAFIGSLEAGKGSVAQDKLSASGQYITGSVVSDYVSHLLGYVNAKHLKPLKLVVNAGNGAAGNALDALEAALKKASVPVEFIKIHHQPDGTFPNGIPNPLLPESRADTANAVKQHKADMGIAWDGDFDRCFLFDEKGDFVEGYYIVGLLAQAFLDKQFTGKLVLIPPA